MTRCTIKTDVETYTHESRDFGAKFKGRALGAQVARFEGDAEVNPNGFGYAIEPGRVFGYRPSATRERRPFGAVQATLFFNTPEAREKDVERYFAAAMKRAKAKAAR